MKLLFALLLLTISLFANIPSNTYDPAGNLQTKTVEGITTEYSYDANGKLIQKGSITYTYDRNGNLIDDGTDTYEYDDKNRLVRVTTPTETIEYSYDAQDHRIAKTTSEGTTTYLVDPNTPYAQVIRESKANGTETRYTYGLRLIGDGEHTFLTDALGSTRGLADRAGQLTDSYDYSPYGELRKHSGTSDTSFLFTGEQYDKETGDYYLRARYYSPTLSRFLTRDTYDGTLADPLSQNPYLYARGNPVVYVDPSGHFFTVMGIGASINISGALRATNQSKSVQIARTLLNQAVNVEGGAKGFLIDIIEDLAIQAVMSTINSEFYSKSTAGTAAHKKFEELLKDAFPGRGKIKWLEHDIYIVPEVFFDSDGNPTGRRSRGSLGVDVAVFVVKKGERYTTKDLKIIFDLKTGQGWNSRHIKKLRERVGDVPIVQIIVPIIGRR